MTIDQKSLAGMGAEPGFDGEESVEPARVSGFVALILGLISPIAFLGTPLLLFPVLAFVFGMFALRRCEGPAPLGTGAAKIGLILAIGFGTFGFAVSKLKTVALHSQAERFSKEYINLIAAGDLFLARELQRSYPNRLPTSMSLQDYYESNPNAQAAMESFRILPLNEYIRKFGPNANWTLDQPIRSDYHFGREQVEVVWRDPEGIGQVQFFLEFQLDPQGVGQWHAETVQRFRERVVAERVL